MIRVSKNELLDMAGWTLFTRGEKYYRSGAVMESFKLKTSKGYEVHAEVQGSEMYHVTLNFDQYGAYQGGQCECPAYAGGYVVCKHMVASLLHAANTYKSTTQRVIPSTQEGRSLIEKVLSSVEEDRTNDEESGHLETKYLEELAVEFEIIIPFLRYSSSLSEFDIKLKIGPKDSRAYVVHDPVNFFRAIKMGEPYTFTSKFTFDPTTQKIPDPEREVMSMLVELVDWYRWVSNKEMMYSSPRIKEISVPPHRFQSVLDGLQQCENVFMRNGKIDRRLKVEKESFPHTFTLEEKDGYYLLSVSRSELPSMILGNTNYLLNNSTIYEMNQELRQSVVPLYQHLSARPEDQQPLTKSQLEQLIGTLFPTLQKYNLLQMDDQLHQKIKMVDCRPELTFDVDEDGIRGEIFFNYGDLLISPFEDSTHSSKTEIIVRDMKKERKVMELIEQSDFRYNGKELTMDDEYSMGDFYYRILPTLEKHCEVHWNEHGESLFMDRVPNVELSLDVDEGNNWFEIGFKTDDLPEEEIIAFLQSVREKRSFHRLSTGQYIPIESEEWLEALSILDQVGAGATDFSHGKIQLPKYRALQIEDPSIGKSFISKSRAYEQLLEAISHPETMDVQPPQGINATLRDYQIYGFQWMNALAAYGFGGILADEMGLGKTIQALSFILSQKEKKRDCPPFLIVAPASLVYNWKKEAEHFTPQLKITLVNGTKQDRRNALEKEEETDLFITSYPLLRRDVELYQDHFFQGIILDEAQAFKNDTSLTYKSVLRLRGAVSFALSGTPVENRAEELWTLFSVIMPGILPKKEQFSSLEPKSIHRRISPFVLRRTKKEVLPELPEKINNSRYTDLSKEQRKLYVGYLHKVQEETKSELAKEGFQRSRMSILSKLTRLRQLCCHPSLFIENYTGTSGKLEELRELMVEARENGQRVLIFSQFTSMLAIIKEVMEKEGYTYFYLDGSTPGKERVQLTERFNEGEGDVFLISLKAGGTGLNLTGADTVVLYDLWWNPAVENQAADRAHRIGQKKVVQVIKLIAQGTIEEKIQELQEKKQHLFDTLIQTGDTRITNLSEEDIREILDMT
ncbi:DEAD/DEAH box helicase [Bacillaceae bacterium S4-13-58]